MRKALLWIGGGLVAVILLLWLSDDGLYIGSETRTAPGWLGGEPVQVEALICRYLTLSGIERRVAGLVPGSDPATLLEHGEQPYVAEGGCRRSYPWETLGRTG